MSCYLLFSPSTVSRTFMHDKCHSVKASFYYFFKPFAVSFLHLLIIACAHLCILFMARSFPLYSVDPVDRDIHKETHDYN